MCQITARAGCPSDESLKDEVSTIEFSVESLMKLEPIEYDWNETYTDYENLKKLNKLHSIGFLAQDVRKVIPDAVTLGGSGYYHVEYPALNAYLVEAIKEQQVFIDDITDILSELEIKVENYNG